jgi:hypothetical protein
VVDEDDFLTIKPLPNLDYKIVCGNSLFKVERNLLNDHLFAELALLKLRFFDEINPRQKKDEKSQIERLIRQLTNNDEHFDYEIYFSEVFHKKRGFDVVIANPPYVRHEGIKEFKPELKKTFGEFYCGTADLYTYFYKRGLEILKPNGHLCFIAPNKFMRAGYGKNTRILLANEATPKVVIDFGDLRIFDATTYPSILLVEKRQPASHPGHSSKSPGLCHSRSSNRESGFGSKTISPIETSGMTDSIFVATFTDATQLERLEETLATVGFTMPVAALKAEGWNLERPDVLSLMAKLHKAGTPLREYVQRKFYRGVLTGLNEAFVIDEATRKQLIAEDPKSAELIKPWLRGRDIRKWKAQWAGLYVIFTRRGTDIEKYPAIKRHLKQFSEDLEPKKTANEIRGRKPGSYKWFDIQDNIAYFEEFERTKIVYQEIATFQSFGYADPGCFCNNKCFLIPRKDDFLLSLFNSKLFWWFLGNLTSGLVGGARAMQMPYVEQLPIFLASETQQTPIIERVQKILAYPDSSVVPQLEAEIDRLVYELYGLTEEEIALVEGKPHAF